MSGMGVGAHGGKGDDYTISAKYTPYSTEPSTDAAQQTPPSQSQMQQPYAQQYSQPAHTSHAHVPQPAAQPHYVQPTPSIHYLQPTTSIQYVQPVPVQYVQPVPVQYVQPVAVQYAQPIPTVQYSTAAQNVRPHQVERYSFPAGDVDQPLFIGATTGHDPILVTCPRCNYNGHTRIRRKKGWGYAVFAMLTFGLGALCGAAKDTHHFCPNCNKYLAYSKLM